MIHETIVVGPFQCNCHILADEATKQAIVIDPGDNAEKILAAVRGAGFDVQYLLHTHAHLDHISGTRAVAEATEGKILIHAEDLPLYENLLQQVAMLRTAMSVGFHDVAEPLKPHRLIRDGEELEFSGRNIRVVHTPGHTPGSCCFETQDGRKRLLFSGDTLFARSIGRTDLWGGDFDTEIASIKNKLLPLDPDTEVFPGHGPKTHIGEEKKKNPFLI